MRRNSAETNDSIRRRSSGDLERAARKNPLYSPRTCFCIPENLGPLDAPIASDSRQVLHQYALEKEFLNASKKPQTILPSA